MLDPRLLRVLYEVARNGSYSAAGRALGCSQPAITQQMRALERAVGTPVAVRVGRRMQLTQVGEILARHADAVVRGVRAAEEEARGFVDRRAGRVRVAAFPSACGTVLPAALAQLADTHPDLHVELVAAEPDASLPSLEAGECDVAVCYDYAGAARDAPGLLRGALLNDRLLLAVPAGHPAARRRGLRLADFAGERWIAGSPPAAARLITWMRASGFAPPVSLFVDDYVALQALVAAGRGVGVLPGLAWHAHRHPGVTAVRAAGLPTRRVYALCWPQMRAVPAVSATLAALRTAAATLRAPDIVPSRK